MKILQSAAGPWQNLSSADLYSLGKFNIMQLILNSHVESAMHLPLRLDNFLKTLWP